MAKILLLEEANDSLARMEQTLQNQGHEVIGFTDEEEALEYAGSHRLDLAIIEIKLRKIHGITVLTELKQAAPQLQAMIVTAYPGLETASAAMHHGAAGYCVKPIEPDELEARVAHILAHPR
jgi:DNA-binding NtrC family response regulator